MQLALLNANRSYLPLKIYNPLKLTVKLYSICRWLDPLWDLCILSLFVLWADVFYTLLDLSKQDGFDFYQKFSMY